MYSSVLISFLASATLALAQNTGDQKCVSSMCISAVMNSSAVTYTLQSQSSNLGYMAIGWGSGMANSPMVIVWPASDGSISLSQRESSGHSMPTVMSSPPSVATADQPASSLSGSTPSIAFTMPPPSSPQVSLIWAYSSQRPSDDPGSTIVQHDTQGTLSLDLSQPISGGSSGGNATTGSGNSTNTASPAGTVPISSSVVPLTSQQKSTIAHALLATIGFIVILPIGAIMARLTRTFTHKWYTGHWILQVLVGGPLIAIGLILGFQLPSNPEKPAHATIGRLLLALYIIQCVLGAVIHFFKMARPGRPPQNYLHAILGLSTIGFALYQVHLGITVQWLDTGLNKLPSIFNYLWIIWVIVLVLLYAGGLALLPKQWRQERESRQVRAEKDAMY